MKLAALAGLAALAACATAAPAAGEDALAVSPPPRATLKVGDRVPALEAKNVTTPGGAPIRIAAGKVNLLVFWATWSEPDKKQMAKLAGMWQRQHDKGFAIAAVSVDDEEKDVGAAARDWGVTFDVGWDEARRVTNAIQPTTMPTTFVIDRKGVVRFLHNGYHDDEAALIEREVESLP